MRNNNNEVRRKWRQDFYPVLYENDRMINIFIVSHDTVISHSVDIDKVKGEADLKGS